MVNIMTEKEYSNGNLIFDGEYYNGQRHGKGKEYIFKDILIFEGEYLNGIRRKGKEYNCNFEGPSGIYSSDRKLWKGLILFNDKKYLIFEEKNLKENLQEKIEELNNNEKLIFEGEYLNGLRWKGKEYNDNGKIKFKGNIQMEKDGKEKNIMMKVNQYLKVNIIFMIEKKLIINEYNWVI